jgi:hypothetical protein
MGAQVLFVVTRLFRGLLEPQWNLQLVHALMHGCMRILHLDGANKHISFSSRGNYRSIDFVQSRCFIRAIALG